MTQIPRSDELKWLTKGLELPSINILLLWNLLNARHAPPWLCFSNSLTQFSLPSAARKNHIGAGHDGGPTGAIKQFSILAFNRQNIYFFAAAAAAAEDRPPPNPFCAALLTLKLTIEMGQKKKESEQAKKARKTQPSLIWFLVSDYV